MSERRVSRAIILTLTATLLSMAGRSAIAADNSPAWSRPGGLDPLEFQEWQKICDAHNWTADTLSLDMGTVSNTAVGRYLNGYLQMAGISFAVGEYVALCQEGQYFQGIQVLSKAVAEAGLGSLGGVYNIFVLTIKYGFDGVWKMGGVMLDGGWGEAMAANYHAYRLARLGQIYRHHAALSSTGVKKGSLAKLEYVDAVNYANLRPEHVQMWLGTSRTDWEEWSQLGSYRHAQWYSKDPLHSGRAQEIARHEMADAGLLKRDQPLPPDPKGKSNVWLNWHRVKWDAEITRQVLGQIAKAKEAKILAEAKRTDYVFKFALTDLREWTVHSVYFQPTRTGGRRQVPKRSDANQAIFLFEVPMDKLEEVFGNGMTGTLVVFTRGATSQKFEFPFDVKEFLRKEARPANLVDGRLKIVVNCGRMELTQHEEAKVQINLKNLDRKTIKKGHIRIDAGSSSAFIQLEKLTGDTISLRLDEALTASQVELEITDAVTNQVFKRYAQLAVAAPPPGPTPSWDDSAKPPPPTKPTEVKMDVECEIARPRAVPMVKSPEGRPLYAQKVSPSLAAAAIAQMEEPALTGTMPPQLYCSGVGDWGRSVDCKPIYDRTKIPPDPAGDPKLAALRDRMFSINGNQMRASNHEGLVVLTNAARRIYPDKELTDRELQRLAKARTDWIAEVASLRTTARDMFKPADEPKRGHYYSSFFKVDRDEAPSPAGVIGSWYSEVRQRAPGFDMEVNRILTMRDAYLDAEKKHRETMEKMRDHLDRVYLPECGRLLDARVDHARAVAKIWPKAMLFVERYQDPGRTVIIRESSDEVRFLVNAQAEGPAAVAILEALIGMSKSSADEVQAVCDHQLQEGQRLLNQEQAARAAMKRFETGGLKQYEQLVADAERLQAAVTPVVRHPWPKSEAGVKGVINLVKAMPTNQQYSDQLKWLDGWAKGVREQIAAAKDDTWMLPHVEATGSPEQLAAALGQAFQAQAKALKADSESLHGEGMKQIKNYQSLYPRNDGPMIAMFVAARGVSEMAKYADVSAGINGDGRKAIYAFIKETFDLRNEMGDEWGQLDAFQLRAHRVTEFLDEQGKLYQELAEEIRVATPKTAAARQKWVANVKRLAAEAVAAPDTAELIARIDKLYAVYDRRYGFSIDARLGDYYSVPALPPVADDVAPAIAPVGVRLNDAWRKLFTDATAKLDAARKEFDDLPADAIASHKWRDRDAMAAELADALSPKLPAYPWGRAVQWLEVVMKQAGTAKPLADREKAQQAHTAAAKALLESHAKKFGQ